MKLFQLVQKNFAALGIHSNQSKQKFDHKILLGFFLFGSTLILSVIYVLREAKTLFEYARCISIIFVFICLITSLSTFAFKMSKYIELFEFTEKMIFDGERKSIEI